MTQEQASIVVDYIRAIEHLINHHIVLKKLDDMGYGEAEVDEALKALGKIAGRDCGIL